MGIAPNENAPAERASTRPAYLAVVLHAHLPFVRHPEHRVFAEEDWLYEAIIETYVPLLQLFERLRADGVPFRLTLSFSATLLSMLGDDLLLRRFERHLKQLQQLASLERKRTISDEATRQLADYYCEQLASVEQTWRAIDGDLVSPLAELQRQGYLDLLTSGATHGYLPLLGVNEQAVWAQVKIGVDQHTRAMGRPPNGIWLPECGYAPGIDKLVARAGLRFFVAERHALLHARPRARYGCYAPVFCADSGVAVFGRDPQSAEQVWSRRRGYPADPVYRDFYRDIGFERAAEELAGFAEPSGRRRHTGIKYHRVTGRDQEKLLYEPEVAARQAKQHARDFVHKSVRQLAQLRTVIPHPVVVAPYDAELFGHWWYEGCQWLEHVLREVALLPPGALDLTQLSSYLEQHPTNQVTRPAQSSWGQGGYHRFWLDGSNAWIYPQLHRAAQRMIELAREHTSPTDLQRRALNHAARQLLLAQASDWAFIMRDNTVVDYATSRTRRHLRDFQELVTQLDENRIDPIWLSDRERIETIFPDLDYRVFAQQFATSRQVSDAEGRGPADSRHEVCR